MNPTLPEANESFRLLLIEDDYDLAKVVCAFFAPLGFDCRYAPDGTTGLETFRSLEPHLVILDVVLPDMSGQDVLAKIRESSNVPVIVLSALDELKEGLPLFKIGADDYIKKPFEPKLLVARVVAHLRRAYRYCAARSSASPQAVTAGGGLEMPTEEPERRLPAGWAECDRCGYIGPYSRFEKETTSGRNKLVCPHCREEGYVKYSIT
jgi:DNA-binding response OmpR family regulator